MAIPLIRFQLRGAAGLAQRNTLGTLAIVIVATALLPDAPAVLRGVGAAAVEHGFGWPPRLVLPVLALLLAIQAMPTFRSGSAGWSRSLPVSRVDARRAVAAGLVAPLVPLYAAVLAAAAVALPAGRVSLSAVLGTGLAIAAAGLVAVPVERGAVARPAAAAAMLFGALASWPATGGAVLLLLAWDRLAGGVVAPAPLPERRVRRDRRLGLLIGWRALGLRTAGSLAIGAGFAAIAWLYRTNNGFTVERAEFGTRVALFAGLLVSLAVLGDGLLARRPPWPWARSLPASATARVLDDAVVLGLPCVPAILLTGLLDRATALAGLAALPLLAVLAAGAVRRGRGRLLQATGVLSWTGSVVVLAVIAIPATAWLLPLLVPPALRHAAVADRNLRVTGWVALHHHAGGDSQEGTLR